MQICQIILNSFLLETMVRVVGFKGVKQSVMLVFHLMFRKMRKKIDLSLLIDVQVVIG